MMQILRKCVISSVIGFSSMIRAQFALPTFQAVNSQDKNGPRITITATDGSNSVASGSLTNDATLTITFTANEAVTGFAVGDVGVTGGSLPIQRLLLHQVTVIQPSIFLPMSTQIKVLTTISLLILFIGPMTERYLPIYQVLILQRTTVR